MQFFLPSEHFTGETGEIKCTAEKQGTIILKKQKNKHIIQVTILHRKPFLFDKSQFANLA